MEFFFCKLVKICQNYGHESVVPFFFAHPLCNPHNKLGDRSFSAADPRLWNDFVAVRSMVNIATLTIWSIYCSRGGSEGRADPLIVAPFIGAA